MFFCSSSGVNETRLAVATAQRGDCFRIDLTVCCWGVSEDADCNRVLSDRASFTMATVGFLVIWSVYLIIFIMTPFRDLQLNGYLQYTIKCNLLVSIWACFSAAAQGSTRRDWPWQLRNVATVSESTWQGAVEGWAKMLTAIACCPIELLSQWRQGVSGFPFPLKRLSHILYHDTFFGIWS